MVDAIRDAVKEKREVDIYGQRALVVSVGHLIATKLVAERKKDTADIVELIKARMESGEWQDDWPKARTVIREFLGAYAARVVERLAKEAEAELGER